MRKLLGMALTIKLRNSFNSMFFNQRYSFFLNFRADQLYPTFLQTHRYHLFVFIITNVKDGTVSFKLLELNRSF